MLFSGGIDSLAGAVEMLEQTDQRIALVAHRSATKTQGYQRDLAQELKRRYPQRVYHVPVSAAMAGGEYDVETTQRTRSFFYAALGFIIARMFGVRTLRFWENGIVTVNLPINAQVRGSMATRTTHPYALRRFRELLSLMGDEPVYLDNPYNWKTRTEVLRGLADNRAADLIRRSVRCSKTRAMAKPAMHCGVCSQCLDRRFSILVAGLADSDPSERCAVDLFKGARTRAQDRTMAVDYTCHWVRMADVSEAELLDGFGGELTRLLDGFPDEDAILIAQRFHHLMRRQGQAVRTVLSREIAEASEDLAAGTLPDTCLLRLQVGSGRTETLEVEATPEQAGESPGSRAAPAPTIGEKPMTSPLPLQLELSDDSTTAQIIGVTDLRGQQVALIKALKVQYDQGLQDQRPRDQHRFVKLHDLADHLELADVEYVRQLVKRLRDDVKKSLAALLTDPGIGEPLIENKRGLAIGFIRTLGSSSRNRTDQPPSYPSFCHGAQRILSRSRSVDRRNPPFSRAFSVTQFLTW